MSGPSDIRAFLSLGGNVGDPASAMAAALDLLNANHRTRVLAVSSIYRDIDSLKAEVAMERASAT